MCRRMERGKKIFILLILALLFCNCQTKAQDKSNASTWTFCFSDTMYVDIDSTEHFYIFSPKYKTMDLACGVRPDTLDSSIIFCVPAAFTGKVLDTFCHENIAGDHVSGGQLLKGYVCEANHLGFVYMKDGSWQFLLSDDYNAFIQHNGDIACAFEQAAVIWCDTVFMPRLYKNPKKTEYFRSLCQMQDGTLRLVMTKEKTPFGDYLQLLCNELHVHHAIYMDMGPGWNYSWYRGDNGRQHDIFPWKRFTVYQTNWLIFEQ